MTLPVSTRRNDYTGTSALHVYAYSFKIFNQSDIKVIVADTNGEETTLTLTTDYTVSGVGEASGGNITLTQSGQAWLTAGELTTGYHLTIIGNKTYLQELSIRNQGKYYPDVVEDQLDKFAVMFQQLKEKLGRAISFVETSTDSAATIGSLEDNAGKVVVVNDDEDGFEYGPTVDSLASDAAAATASAAAASSSASAASASASAAAVSATASAASATAAEASADAAAASAASAASSTLADGDYGDVVVSGSGSVISLDTGVVTAAAKTVLDDASTSDMRTTLGLEIGTDVQAYDTQLDSLSVASADGVSLVTAADYAAMKGLLDLEIGTDVQAYDAQLDSLSAASANGVSLVTAADYATMKGLLDLEIGTDVQAYDAQLSSLIRQNSKTAAYTTVLSDGGKHIFHPASDDNARTFTIDSNANVAYPIGTAITFINEINTVTIAITSDTLNFADGDSGGTGSRTLAANGMATAIKTGTTSWWISGTGLS